MIRGTDFILNPDKLEEQFQLVEVSEWIDYNTKEKLRLKPRNQEPIRLTDRLITYWHASSEYKKNMEFYVNGFSRMAMEVIPMQET